MSELHFVPVYCTRRHDVIGYKLLTYERSEMEHVLCVNAKDLWDQLGVWSGFRPITSPYSGSASHGQPISSYDGPRSYEGLTTDMDLLLGGACLFSWVERELAETNPAWKQLIPVVIFHTSGADPKAYQSTDVEVGGGGFGHVPPTSIVRETRVFTYTRMKGQGEKRLHGKSSIGVGGHINPVDVQPSTSAQHIVKSFDPKEAYFTGMQRELSEEVTISGSIKRPRLVGLIYDPSTPVGEVHLGMVHTIEVSSPDQVVAKDENMGDPRWNTLTALSKEPNLEPWAAILLPHLSSILTPHA